MRTVACSSWTPGAAKATWPRAEDFETTGTILASMGEPVLLASGLAGRGAGRDGRDVRAARAGHLHAVAATDSRRHRPRPRADHDDAEGCRARPSGPTLALALCLAVVAVGVDPSSAAAQGGGTIFACRYTHQDGSLPPGTCSPQRRRRLQLAHVPDYGADPVADPRVPAARAVRPASRDGGARGARPVTSGEPARPDRRESRATTASCGPTRSSPRRRSRAARASPRKPCVTRAMSPPEAASSPMASSSRARPADQKAGAPRRSTPRTARRA